MPRAHEDGKHDENFQVQVFPAPVCVLHFRGCTLTQTHSL